MYSLVKKAEEGLKAAGVSVKLFQVLLLLAWALSMLDVHLLT